MDFPNEGDDDEVEQLAKILGKVKLMNADTQIEIAERFVRHDGLQTKVLKKMRDVGIYVKDEAETEDGARKAKQRVSISGRAADSFERKSP